MIRLITVAAAMFAISAPALADAGKSVTPAEPKAEVLSKPAACPKGTKKFAVFTKIERSKSGMVTETFKTFGGAVGQNPPFKPTAKYKMKVGDFYCVDGTPDND